MPASAGRVRMPHNNRMSTSATLKTSDVWSKTIGHDPHASVETAAQQEQSAAQQQQEEQAVKAVFAAARAQSVSTSVVGNFSSQLFRGLKSSKNIDPKVEEEQRRLQIERGVSDGPTSSSEDEFIVVKRDRKKQKKRKHKHSSEDDESSKEERRKKESKKKRHRKKRRDEEDEESDSSSSQRKRKHRKKKKRSKRRHRSPDSGDDEKSKKKNRGPPFVAATQFEGSKPGYVFHVGPQGLGYYVDRV